MQTWMSGIKQLILIVKQSHLFIDNMQGVLHGIGCCLPIMKKNNCGHIINISSDGGLRVLLRMNYKIAI